jgi:hypothetical protein
MKLNPEQTFGFCRETPCDEFVRCLPNTFDFHGVEGFASNPYFLLRIYKCSEITKMSVFSKN